MQLQRMTLEFVDGVAVLKFNHPEVMNAIGAQMLSDFSAAINEIRRPGNGARCLLLTGEGRGFCSGANLADPGRAQQGSGEVQAGDVLRDGYNPLMLALRNLDMPMVSAVNGAAAGVGMSLAILADIVCASRSAYFLQAFSRVGLVPDGGATFLLPRLIGWGRAVEMSLLAERLPAEKAREWGLVNFLFDDSELMSESMKIAQRLANGPKALSMTRRAYWASTVNSFEQQMELEAQLQSVAGATGDFREGVMAFLQKREAKFQGN